jgi:hypothetical protein
VPSQQIDTILDNATVERLSAALNECFVTLDVDDAMFTDDAFFDLLPPFWRFQMQGPRELERQLRAISQGRSTVRTLRVVPAANGFVLEHEEAQPDGGEVARRLLLCEVRDGRIAEVVCYCNGGWDAALRERHAAEAPMLRP